MYRLKSISLVLLCSIFLFGFYIPSPITVEEDDGSPTQANPSKLKFPNGTLTKSGTTITVNTLPKLPDTDASHTLELKWNENEASANRIFNFLVNGADRSLNFSGNLTLANNLTTAGNYALTLTTTGTTSLTLPTSGTLFTTSGGTLSGALTLGQDDTGYNFKVFGDTSGKYSLWNQAEDKQYIIGAFEVGDLTNYLRVSNTGLVSYAGSAKPTDCIFLTPATAYLPDGNPRLPAALVNVEGTLNFLTLDYDAAQDEEAYWDVAIPDAYDEGNATVKVYWYSAAAVAGDAQFDIDSRSVGNSEAVDGAATDTACTLQTTDGTAGDMNFSTCTLTTPFDAGDVARIGLRRDISEEGGSALVGDARVRGVRVCWSVGS